MLFDHYVDALVACLAGEEVWRDVAGFEPSYQVSNLGNVRSKERKIGHVLFPAAPIYQEPHQCYRRVAFRVNGARIRRRVHALVLEAFMSPRPDGCESRHLDGDGANNRLDNLCWGTPRQNTADKRRHGTMSRGEAINSATITEDQARFIRLVGPAVPRGRRSEFARALGVSHAAVRNIVNGRNWTHLA